MSARELPARPALDSLGLIERKLYSSEERREWRKKEAERKTREWNLLRQLRIGRATPEYIGWLIWQALDADGRQAYSDLLDELKETPEITEVVGMVVKTSLPALTTILFVVAAVSDVFLMWSSSPSTPVFRVSMYVPW